MRSLWTAIFLILVVPCTTLAAELGSAQLSLLKGDVQIYTEDTREWVAASINMPLAEGDRLWVPEGARAEVHIQGGVYVRLGSGTAFDILDRQEESYQFYLNGGHAYINNRQGGVEQIQIDTPLASVGCYDNSLSMIDVTASGTTDIAVVKGYATAATQTGNTRVEAGNALHIAGDMAADITPLSPPDEWETWNRERDKKLAGGQRSLRYLPEELDDYAYDFDEYGRWVYITDYGYCWKPLRISADWSPYRIGKWCWVGGSYVWISYEPWGWVPHHYGRWTFLASFGWCWVPPGPGGIYWSPGYVGWVHTPTYVAWVPLAPGEIYYGYGYYGPRSIDIRRGTVNRSVIRDFRNVNVRNAVTVVDRTTFISGRTRPTRASVNPFRASNATIGLPSVKPTRDTVRPVIRTVPAAKRPPERVRQLSVKEIQRERPRIRDEKGSSLTPGRAPVEMPVKRRSAPQKMIRQEHPAIQAPKATKGTTSRGAAGQPSTPEPAPGRGSGSTPGQTAPPVHQKRAVTPVQPHQSVAPVQPAGIPAGRGKTQREPRWQEPLPGGKPAAGHNRESAPKAAPAQPVQPRQAPVSPQVAPGHSQPRTEGVQREAPAGAREPGGARR